MSTIKVAVTNHEPAWLDLPAGVAKTIDLITEASSHGCKFIAFPETWLIGYPAWIWSRPVDSDLSVKYVQNSLRVPSPEMDSLCAAAAEHDIAVSLGFSERCGDSVFIAQALIDATGKLRMNRRKMKPTHMERTIFGDASGDCLSDVVDVAGLGKVGALSCWEHIQPLLKFHQFSQGEQIHVAAWPALHDFEEGSPGFWSMSTDGCLGLSQTYAVESGAFVLSATTVISENGIEAMGTKGSPIMGTPNQSSSAIIGPDGRILAGGAGKGKVENEQLLIADIDLIECTKAKTFADACGHYSRPDLLWLGCDGRKKGLVKPYKVL
ncbi:MAG: hypothetical protein LQ343_003947 [Gyalolechia ehrenbergii]|nr:MAG: hypothetical protein LQ343_003947 [Gyalolechia ehrenbergii]